jgi:LAO/AO transport system kinase
VFIRSMATRGSLGGLAARTGDLCELLDAWGSETTLVETVGVGQSELDVAEATDTTVVILTPESGDAIQALKAGLMEIAEVIVLNKADHAGADAMEAALRASLAFRPEGNRPPIVRTVATARQGLDELHRALQEHREASTRPEVAGPRRRDKVRARIRTAVREGLLDAWLHRRGFEDLLNGVTEDVIAGRTSPYRAARGLIERMTRDGERTNGNGS